MDATAVDEDVFANAMLEGKGWCPRCQDFTTDDVYFKETHRFCDQCGELGVQGPAAARQNDFIEVSR